MPKGFRKDGTKLGFKKGHNFGFRFYKGHKINLGKKHPNRKSPPTFSEEHREKISLKLKGRKFSDEHKRKMSLSLMGNKRWLGKKHNDSWRKKILKSLVGIPKTEEHKKKLSESRITRGVAKLNRNPNWRGGKSFEPYPFEWNLSLKRKIREKYNYLCQICSNAGNSIHHIDYDKNNCKESNLINLCRSCHTKTNFKREYWINYFKKYGEVVCK